MIKILSNLLLIVCASATASESPVVDTRLATIVEAAVKETGLDINISMSETYSLNIDTINGRNVCDPAMAADAKRLQEAFDKQLNIKDNFGPAFYSVTNPDGSRKVLSPDELKKQGVLKKCTNIYVSVSPR